MDIALRSKNEIKKPVIIFFDSLCIFCNSFASFIAARDKKNLVRFGYLQDSLAQEFAKNYDFQKAQKNLDSLVVIKNNKIFLKSTAAIMAISSLGFPYNLLKIFLIIPQKIRNIFYDFFGKNRYKWFGKKEFCKRDEEVVKRLLKQDDF